MAYIKLSNGETKWLRYEERADYLAELTEEKRLLTKLIKAGLAYESDLARMEEVLDEEERIKRIQRSEHDMLYFMYEYFSEEGNPGNDSNLIPKGQFMSTSANFHQELCEMLDDVTKGIVSTHIAWSVGRRHAKTAYLSNGYLVHQLVFRLQKYVALISKTTDMAGDFITWARYQLKHNEKLRNDFGELLKPKASLNELDNKYEFITTTQAKVEAKGLGTQVRGMRHLSERPSLFILDDLEDHENTNTKELREKNLNWFRSELLEALGFGGMCVYMGTIVHYDSLLNHVVSKRRDFNSRTFPAITSWSEREDLWEEWRKIYSMDSPDAKEKADAFYEENKEEMTKGTSVLWSEMYDYLYFMEKREDIGARAFNQEYLGNPTDEESQVFRTDDFMFFRESDLDGKEFHFYAAADFAMGKEKGDYSALVTLAKNVNTGICYVVDVYMERVHPDKFLKEIIKRTFQYQYEALAVESQQAQEWFADKLSEELRERGYPSHTRLHKVKQKTRKALRIEALLPEIQSGRIRFQKHHRLLLEMFELYPSHNHDDGPDALADAYKLAKGGQTVVQTINRRMR